MFPHVVAFSTLFVLAFSAPNPIAPSPSDKFAAGSQCTIQWTADPNGIWTNMNIGAASYSSFQILSHHVLGHRIDDWTQFSYDSFEEYASIPDDRTFTPPGLKYCPPGPIVFYQFTDQADPKSVLWTGRFTITDADGTSDPAPYTDSNGVGYGNATFEDTSLYNAQPSYLVGNGQLVQTAGPSPSSTATGSSITSVISAATTTTASFPGKMSTTPEITSSTITGTTAATTTATTTTSAGAALALSVPGSTFFWVTLLGMWLV
ncbi:uncharacterized protein EI90DRAFT_3245846 [Cantharellus anzutake]|uniref:uncharacterized protein n=1 Tax=Cantharellus anzutake TaxID=1750568 RepID=UPI001905C041|nr:uncharacterized protein EI90DRAFT_3245846 [Cantharellus anzutake]KAF8323523.1 hypothetical protein EI90DRAFT_3245846 [Cantharellus anzutake]